MIKAVLHIGLPKTATTSLQNILKLDDRINFIKTRKFCTTEYYTDGIFLPENDLPVVFSEENTVVRHPHHLPLDNILNNLKNTFYNYEIHIVVTIREQCSLLLSRYKHGITYLNGCKLLIEEWLSTEEGLDYIGLCQFNNLYLQLSKYFEKDKIHFIPFELLFEKNNKYLVEFYKHIGISPKIDAQNKISNKNMEDKVLFAIRKINKIKLGNLIPLLRRIENKIVKEILKSTKTILPEKVIEFPKNELTLKLEKMFRQENYFLLEKIKDPSLLYKYKYLIDEN